MWTRSRVDSLVNSPILTCVNTMERLWGAKCVIITHERPCGNSCVVISGVYKGGRGGGLWGGICVIKMSAKLVRNVMSCVIVYWVYRVYFIVYISIVVWYQTFHGIYYVFKKIYTNIFKKRIRLMDYTVEPLLWGYPFCIRKMPIQKCLSSGVEINTFMFRFTLSSGHSKGGGLSSGWPLKRGSTVFQYRHCALGNFVRIILWKLNMKNTLIVICMKYMNFVKFE